MSSFGDIRAFFATPPAREHIWEELVVLLDSFTPREQLAEVVINLINGLGHLFEDGIGNGEDFAYGHGP